MKLYVEVNSGAAYLLSLSAVVTYAIINKAPFPEFWIAVGALYGWHTGRRLWKTLKTPAGTVIDQGEDNGKAA